MTLDNSNSLLRVLSWNLRFQGFGKQIDGISDVIENDRADVLTFQEVSEKHSTDFLTRLENLGYQYQHDAWQGTLLESGRKIRHGVLITSKHK
jgi:endonuclease/exonuclease/phosphatase family metal-dependent hydrolase